jgi:hypothetical protein
VLPPNGIATLAIFEEASKRSFGETVQNCSMIVFQNLSVLFRENWGGREKTGGKTTPSNSARLL